MTRYATILLLAATSTAQFAGDAAAGGAATKPNLPKQTNWTVAAASASVAPATPPAAPSAPPMEAVGRGED